LCGHAHPVALDLERGEVVSDQTQIPAELLYEYVLQTTQMVEYGVSIQALMAGQVAPPPEGVRFDVHFEGPVTGTKLNGSAKGVDYIHMRADGRTELNIQAEVTTADGKKIALSADGVAMGAPPVLQLRENVKLTTSHPEYAWVNPIQVWGVGSVDFSTGEIRVKGYAA
jgi:hypothetical protein